MASKHPDPEVEQRDDPYFDPNGDACGTVDSFQTSREFWIVDCEDPGAWIVAENQWNVEP
jgi:hypothetical protein